MSRKRLDAVLAERGLFETRSRAAAAVIAGDVRLGDQGHRAEKPGQMVAEEVAVEVADKARFVSRGGQKLANALDAFGLDPAGRQCLDAGAAATTRSTPGSTSCDGLLASREATCTSPAITAAAARERDSNRPRSASRLSSRTRGTPRS